MNYKNTWVKLARKLREEQQKASLANMAQTRNRETWNKHEQ